MRVWDLNPIVLAHFHRFFSAALRAVETRPDDDLPVIAELAANLVWANSSFVGVDAAQEQAMATTAAIASTFAGRLAPGSSRQAAAVEAFSQLERDLWSSLDRVLERLLAELVEGGHEGSPPAVVDRWVWDWLFPGYPWGCQADLEEAIRGRIGG